MLSQEQLVVLLTMIQIHLVKVLSNLIAQLQEPRGAISVTDAGGDGSLAYNSTSGVLTYTGLVRQKLESFNAGTGVVPGGAISIRQAVGTTMMLRLTQLQQM